MKMCVLLQVMVEFCLHQIFLVIDNKGREITTDYTEEHILLVYVGSSYHTVKIKQNKGQSQDQKFLSGRSPTFNDGFKQNILFHFKWTTDCQILG